MQEEGNSLTLSAVLLFLPAPVVPDWQAKHPMEAASLGSFPAVSSGTTPGLLASIPRRHLLEFLTVPYFHPHPTVTSRSFTGIPHSFLMSSAASSHPLPPLQQVLGNSVGVQPASQ